MLGFFPYQLDTHRFVIAVYVMTRDLGRVYDRRAPGSDTRRLDLPPARGFVCGSGGSTEREHGSPQATH